MKLRFLAAAAVAAISAVVYRYAEQGASAERGYTAFGGEELLFLAGIALAIWIYVSAFQRKKKSGIHKATANQTESEQSESKSP